jgi:surfeit locus 1 family protein
MSPPSTRPPRFWLITLATVVVVAIGIALGFWQLDRARQKLSLEAGIQTQGALPMLDDSALAADPATLVHRRARLKGQWLADATLFLDNRQMQGRPGFFVLTPLRLPTGGAVLVQRGWAPRDFQDRTRLPQVPTEAGDVELVVRLAPPPAKLYEFAGGGLGPIRQNIDLAALSQELKLPLLPLSALQTSEATDGLLRDWPAPATDVHKHYGYAFQWFALATLILGLYVWFQLIRPRRAAR